MSRFRFGSGALGLVSHDPASMCQSGCSSLKCLLALKTGPSKQTEDFSQNYFCQNYFCFFVSLFALQVTWPTGGQHRGDLTFWCRLLIGCVPIINHFDN